MNIAVVTRFVHHVGGIESYLAAVMPALASRGHRLRVWHEHPADPKGAALAPDIVSTWLGPEAGAQAAALADLSAWRPDLLFLHGLDAADLQERLPQDVPVVTMLHAYDGTCISGTKLHAFPTPTPCSRPLGPGCLVNYYPRRCGGWHPGTMLRLYGRQRRHQRWLTRSTAVATLSAHMGREAIAQGVHPSVVTSLPQFVPAPAVGTPVLSDRRTGRHVGFVGRLEWTKGVHLLLEAIGVLAPRTLEGLQVTIAGDGRDRPGCEAAARRLRDHGVRCAFTGWLAAGPRAALLDTLDLLVVPSIWPEPFGLVGLEAAAACVPALAFDLGGIGEWLQDDVTGRLLPGPARARTLAAGLEDCLADRTRLRAWGAAAGRLAATQTLDRHVDALVDLFERTAQPTASGRSHAGHG